VWIAACGLPKLERVCHEKLKRAELSHTKHPTTSTRHTRQEKRDKEHQEKVSQRAERLERKRKERCEELTRKRRNKQKMRNDRARTQSKRMLAMSADCFLTWEHPSNVRMTPSREMVTSHGQNTEQTTLPDPIRDNFPTLLELTTQYLLGKISSTALKHILIPLPLSLQHACLSL
jgi:hypothetical protein